MLNHYSVKEAASILSLNEETVRRWIRDGKLKAEDIGGRVGYRIAEDELKRFILAEKGVNSFTEEVIAKLGAPENLFNSMFSGSHYFQSILKQKLRKNADTTVQTENRSESQLEIIKAELELQTKATFIKSEIAKLQFQLEQIEHEILALKKLQTLNKEQNN
ncbi:MAG: helix-turn-helix domain-containing protein [Paenibacillus macerans]|uniref:helix-turn-helix domain-containing protein n=1 Tax=Paenibacillus macerans TaxID=44252 RepID=UPI00242BC3E0|nr:helix-turn-helix domain-containing protein [Paenibacillus macerans]MBS5913102.1 helix-turn-helix domain-containing protein [Paenibacillus macerans]